MRASEGGEQVTHLGRGNKECKDSGAGAGLRLELNGQGTELVPGYVRFFKSQERVHTTCQCHRTEGFNHGNGHDF